MATGIARRSGRLVRIGLALLAGCLLLATPVGAACGGPCGGGALVPPTASLPPPSGPLPTGTVYVAETGHYLRGAFLDYWRGNGGAEPFGYPLSEEYVEAGTDGVPRTMQLFDAARFELHRDGTGVVRVELGQLGREALGGRSFTPVPSFTSTPDRIYVAATGHSLALGFLAFWREHDGLSRLGYPLSEEIASGDRTIQYFERGRLEYDPRAGVVLAAPLGLELLSQRGWPAPARIALSFGQSVAGQGTTASATLFSDRPVVIEGARYDDRDVTLFGGGTYFRALIGVAPSDDVGAHRLTVRLHLASSPAAPISLSADLAVRETPFPRDRIIVPPDQSDLLDPAVGERELRIVTPLYGLFTPRALWSAPFLLPAQGPITTEFGEMRAYNDGPFNSWHNGLDIGADEGAPIVAPAPGRVVYAGRLDIRGYFTAIDHGLGILTCYFHQSAILVTVGQTVQAGDRIGRVGTTGLSTGPHLHWEVRVQGVPVSPWQWVAGVR